MDDSTEDKSAVSDPRAFAVWIQCYDRLLGDTFDAMLQATSKLPVREILKYLAQLAQAEAALEYESRYRIKPGKYPIPEPSHRIVEHGHKIRRGERAEPLGRRVDWESHVMTYANWELWKERHPGKRDIDFYTDNEWGITEKQLRLAKEFIRDQF